MKTLHVETGRHLYGGAQQVLYLLQGLVGRGFDAELACPPGSAIADAAKARNIPVRELDCRGDLDLRFIGRLRRAIDDSRPDLVHCHSRRGADFLGGQAASMAGVPAVVSRRVDNPESRFAAALRYRRFRCVIAISEAIRQVLVDAGVEPSRIRVIRSSVDIEQFRAGKDRDALARAFGVEPSYRLVLSAAQMIARKGQHHLLEAAAAIADRHPDLHIVLCGQGPEEARLKALARKLDIADRVHFAGFRDDLDDYLGAFDMLVHTALAEGLGVILLKAAAAGLPVVAFEAGGVPEVVAEGETGILVPPADVASLADAMAALLDDRRRLDRYARNARARAAREFSVDTMVDEHLRLYDEVLTNGG